MRLYCDLCGLKIRLSFRNNGLSQRSWMYNARALWLDEEGHAHVSGVGYASRSPRAARAILAPSSSSESYLSTPSVALQTWNVRQGGESEVPIAIHDACWCLLRERLDAFQPPLAANNSRNVEWYLYKLINSLSWNGNSDGGRVHGHDFEGTAQFSSWMLRKVPPAFAFLEADPQNLTIGPFFPTFQRRYLDHDATGQNAVSLYASSPRSDIFSTLPDEVKLLVASFMRSVDLANTRLASRTWARLAVPSRLPQTFWRSRFAADHEMGFLTIYDARQGFNWRGYYFDVLHLLRNGEDPDSHHVLSRRRIWNSLRHVTDSLIPLHGTGPSSLSFEQVLETLEPLGHVIGDPIRAFSCHDEAAGNASAGFRFRLFGMGYISFPPFLGDDEYGLGVTCNTFDGMPFICGFRLLKNGQPLVAESLGPDTCGIIPPFGTETILPLSSTYPLEGIQVATSYQGIVGVAFCYKAEDPSERTRSAGIIHELPASVGVATIVPQEGNEIAGIAVGFDACSKAVSIQLTEWPVHGQAPSSPKTTVQAPDIQPTTATLWHPAEPDLSDLAPHPPIFVRELGVERSLLVNMNFGGTHGNRLSELVRVVAFHDDARRAIRGLGFFFADNSSEIYGFASSLADRPSYPSQCIEQSLAIDGPGGERIVSIQYTNPTEGRKGFLEGIKMITNWQMVLKFQCEGDLVRPPSYVTAPNSDLDASGVITGIVARVGLYTGFFQTLATYSTASVCNRGREATSLSVMPDDGSVATQELLDHLRITDNGNTSLYTAVPPADVQSIRVSAGRPGRARESDKISGLCIEMIGSSVPIYVGQWIYEIAMMRLEPGEVITEMNFWERDRGALGRADFGKIAGMGIVLARPQSTDVPRRLSVCLDDEKKLVNRVLRPPLDSEQWTLVWSMSERGDLFGIGSRPSKPRNGAFVRISMSMLNQSARTMVDGITMTQEDLTDHDGNGSGQDDIKVEIDDSSFRSHLVWEERGDHIHGCVCESSQGKILKPTGHTTEGCVMITGPNKNCHLDWLWVGNRRSTQFLSRYTGLGLGVVRRANWHPWNKRQEILLQSKARVFVPVVRGPLRYEGSLGGPAPMTNAEFWVVDEE